jgi:hypothetical protein
MCGKCWISILKKRHPEDWLLIAADPYFRKLDAFDGRAG